MKTTVLTLLALTVIAAGVSAQVWMDPFTYPDGPLASVGGWNAVAGAWTVKNNIAVAEDKFLWQYANQPNRTFQDGVAQCLVAHNGGATNTLQFGGVALRCVGTSDTVMVKVQNNSSATNPTSFDSIWLYEQPGSAATKTGITPTFPRALVRLALLGQRAEAFVDSDLDGKWDHVVSTTLTGTPKVAPVGIDGFGGVQIDDFEIFDAVILGDTANPRPTPGSTLKYVLRGKSGAGYQAATSLSNSGIVLPDGRIIPLTPDTIFTVSVTGVLPTVFSNYANWLDINGDGSVKLAVPPATSLVGITLFTAFITYDASGILQVSNDHRETIVQ